jgi:hypothetical protein
MLLIIGMPHGNAQDLRTESELVLQDNRYGTHHYKVLRQRCYDSSQYLHTIQKVNIRKDGELIAALRLPITDFEAKNFEVSKIEETTDGFLIAANWGGGNYIYDNTYYFVYKGGQFYLRDIYYIFYVPDSEKKESHHKKLQPPVALSNVDILLYLEKE